MNFRSERSLKKPSCYRKTTKLGIEQLESRLMNSIDSLSSNLQLLSSPGLFGTTQIVLNTSPSVASPLSLSRGTSVSGRTAALTVLGADDAGESTLKYNWQLIDMPTGGTVTFAANQTNAARNNSLTFNKPGEYQIRVTIVDAQGLTATSTLQFNVMQTLTRFVIKTPEGKTVIPGAAISTGETSRSLTIQGLDQFGALMEHQPTIVWQASGVPTGATVSLVAKENKITATFNRAGAFSLRAQSGSILANVTINVRQTVASLTVTPGTASLQTNTNQQYRYQTVDQFGQVITNQPAATWTTTGGTITSSGVLNSGIRAGTFMVTAKIGTVSSTARITVIAPTAQNTLHDGALASLVSNLYSDSQLTRTEMIQVLRSAGADGVVDATELEDLRFIASSSSVFSMPAYVRELAKDVVNSNSANRTFKGQAAGNLAAGSSSTLLNNLVDKWFLGADEPILTGSGLSYQTVVGNLFNGTPSRNDARQGQLGDCYFIASLVSIADHNPDAVRNLFIDNSDGTYTVRFYAGALGSFSNNGLVSAGFISGTGTADYVTVNRRLPTNTNGRLRFSGYGMSIANSATTLWIALAEKAYAQWNETGNEGRDGINRYSSIEGGWMSNVNAQVLGYNSTNYAFSNTQKQSLVNALSSGKSVTLGTLRNASAGGLVGGHAYTVAGYNASTDTFSLHNPWGTFHPSQLTWSQLQSNCSMFTVADPAGSVTNNLASVRSSTSATFVGNWTTVVAAQMDSFSANIREFEEMETEEPLFAIHGSSLEGESSSARLVMSEVSPKSDRDIAVTTDARLENPLVANLVDMAMIHLNLNAI